MSTLIDLLPDVLKDITTPLIVVHPLNRLTVSKNMPIILAVVAIGHRPIAYQWQENGVDIPGATKPVLTIPRATAVNSGTYTCTCSNDHGTVVSEPCVVNVKLPPVIVTQPIAVVKNVGESVTLTIVADGATPLTYQWKKAGVVIPGATSTTYVKVNAQTTDSGSYSCTVTNAYGSIHSTAVTVTVNAVTAKPVITAQPVGGSFEVGNSMLLSITATGALSYQWKLNGSSIRDATSTTYSVVSVGVANAGSYTCVATNVSGDTTSEAAVVTVTGYAPVIDLFDISGDGTKLMKGDLQWFYVQKGYDPEIRPSITVSVSVTGTAPLTYQWQIDQRGSYLDKDGALGVRDVAGATSASYTFIALKEVSGFYTCKVVNAFGSAISSKLLYLAVDNQAAIITDPISVTVNEGQPLWVYNEIFGYIPELYGMPHAWFKDGVQVTPFELGLPEQTGLPSYITQKTGWGPLFYKEYTELTDAGNYFCKYFYGNTDPSNPYYINTAVAVVGVNLVGIAPTITTQPVGGGVNWGAPFALTVGARGTYNNYQWYFNGIEVSGANSATYDIPSVTDITVGSYFCVITNDYGSVTSDSVDVSVQNNA